MQYNYDIVVVGGGSAGLFAASVAHAMGARTCLVEKKKLGGDCTWFGCIPSKTLLKSAAIANSFRDATRYGLSSAGADISANRVLEHVREIVEFVYSQETPEIFEKKGISVITGAPEFKNEYTLAVGNQTVTGKKFIVCTGGHPRVPSIEGLKDISYLTSESVFNLEKPPKNMVVIGGGPIGIELSQAFSRLGTRISVVQNRDMILPREEPEVSVMLLKRLRDERVEILLNTDSVKFYPENGQICAVLKSPVEDTRIITASCVLVATGRAPNVEGLALEKAGVRYSPAGIVVNEYLQTTNRNIFACGDVTGPYLFTHVAAYQASVCVRNALFRRIVRQKASYSNIVWTTFTDPEIAHLGMTEAEARKTRKNVRIYRTEYRECDRAVTDGETEGFVKVITDFQGRILGAHIIGSKAGELIQGFVLAKSLGVPLAKLAQILYPYPTLSELVKKTAAKNLVEKINNPFIRVLLKMLKRMG